jgi:hypothetical protein
VFLIPFERTAIGSPLSVPELVARLRHETDLSDDRGRWPTWLGSFVLSSGGSRFEGRVSDDGFRIMPRLRQRVLYRPVLAGRLRANEAGGVIELRAYPQPVELIFLLAIFGWMLVAVVAHKGVWYPPFLFFAVYHCVGYFVGFVPAVRGALSWLHGLKSGTGPAT